MPWAETMVLLRFVKVLCRQLDNLVHSGRHQHDVESEGFIGEFSDLDQLGFQKFGGHTCCSNKAETASVAHRSGEVRISNPGHASLHEGVGTAQQTGDPVGRETAAGVMLHR
jgi:hypothetical protein